MTHTSVDARDAYAQSVFWAAASTGSAARTTPTGDDECLILVPDGAHCCSSRSPRARRSRAASPCHCHLDLQPVEGTRDDELARLLGVDAVTVDDRRLPDGTGWVVLADPEGNEFCILRSDAEHATSDA